MSDDFPVTPAGDPTRNLKIDGGDSSGNGLPLAHQGAPHIFAAPTHPTIVPYTVCTGKAPGRTRDITRRSGIGFRPDPGREAQMVNKPPAPAASISPDLAQISAHTQGGGCGRGHRSKSSGGSAAVMVRGQAICSLAAMRNCAETASRITECARPRSCGPRLIRRPARTAGGGARADGSDRIWSLCGFGCAGAVTMHRRPCSSELRPRGPGSSRPWR